MRACPNFDDVAILVVGDVMLDRFWTGSTDRVSPEAPVPVVKVQHSENRAGGAGNVAVNIAALGGAVTLAGLCGEDEAAGLLRRAVEQAGVTWAVCPSAVETIVKLRVLSRHQQLLRMDFEGSLAQHADDMFTAFVRARLDAVSTVVLSDYAKGTLTRVQDIIGICREAGKQILVDPKGTDLTRYRGATVLTPNLSEFEAVVGHCESEQVLIERGIALRDQLELQALLITRSDRGMTLLERGCEPVTLPARAREVFDVTGAGDTVISVLASAMAVGMPLPEATAMANTAAGLVVGKLGTASVTRAELNTALTEEADAALPHVGEVLSESGLLTKVAQARAAGERLVMTNGCFDILHRGHMAYLARARALGDRLIVAVNTDESVRRLKGESRPINDVASRMALLSALRSVDWVVPFDADTPADLIEAVIPDVLVKGGDYEPKDIVGYDTVVKAGGKVCVLDFVEGFSTTRIIDLAAKA